MLTNTIFRINGCLYTTSAACFQIGTYNTLVLRTLIYEESVGRFGYLTMPNVCSLTSAANY